MPAMLTEDQLHNDFFIGEYEILPARRLIRRGSDEVSPEPKVFDVLLALARRNGDVVSRDELVEEVWDGRATADGPINRAVSQLRGHFDDRATPYHYVAAKQRVGYFLKQPVRFRAASAWRQRKFLLAAAAALVLAIAVTFVGRDWTPSASSGAIGVRPFVVATDVAGDEHIALGLKEELVRALNNVADVTVKNLHVRYDDESVRQISERLDVDIVLSGSMLRRGDSIEIGWAAELGDDGSTLKSGSVRGSASKLSDLQQSLVMSVRKGLFPDAQQKLITEAQSSGAGTDSYYLGLFALEHRGAPANLDKAIEHFQAAIRLDPQLSPAYLGLATAYALQPVVSDAPIDESNRLAVETIEAGVAVDGTLQASAGAIHGFVYHRQKRWQESETAYVQATNAAVVDANAFNWYSRMLASVGRLDRALEEALKALRIDPDSAIINSRVAIAYTWLGDTENAGRFFERAAELGAGGVTHLLANAFYLFREGQVEEAIELTTSSVQLVGGETYWIVPVFDALTDPAKRSDTLVVVDKAASEGVLSYQVEVVARTMLGDLDNALAVAQKLIEPGEVFEMDLLFTPEMLPLRRHPGFLPLMADLGVTDYWQQEGCTFDGDKVHCDGP